MRAGAAGIERAAGAALQMLGAGRAYLVLAQAATASDQDGLGLNAAVTNEVVLEPALVQTSANGGQLLAITTGSAMRRALSGAAGATAKQMLRTAMLRAGSTRYRITAVTVKHYGDVEMLYELGIEA